MKIWNQRKTQKLKDSDKNKRKRNRNENKMESNADLRTWKDSREKSHDAKTKQDWRLNASARNWAKRSPEQTEQAEQQRAQPWDADADIAKQSALRNKRNEKV